MSEYPNTGGPAFPENDGMGCVHEGMTLRDYFAAKAMQGIVSNLAPGVTNERLAAESYLLADAMLAQREKPQEAK